MLDLNKIILLQMEINFLAYGMNIINTIPSQKKKEKEISFTIAKYY